MGTYSESKLKVSRPAAESFASLGNGDEEARQREVGRLQQRVRTLEAAAARSGELELELRSSKEAAELTVRQLTAVIRQMPSAVMTDELVAVVVHELRTPLNAVLGWVRMLRGDKLAEAKKARALETIERNANALTLMTQSLLDASRIVSGTLRLEDGPVDLPKVVGEAIESLRSDAEAKGVTLHTTVGANGTILRGDTERIRQVVWHLLDNAIKHTPKGAGVRVAVRWLESAAEIVVSDDGQGIDPQLLAGVFDRLHHAGGGGRERRHGGLGLGLAIVKHLVELHGGTAKAESEGRDKGATFRVTLSAALSTVDTPKRSHERRSPALPDCHQLEGRFVLVVDDEDDARDMLTVMLGSYGAHVIAAGSAAEALQRIEELRPDVLVSDIGMPEEDGYALIEKIRALPACKGGRTPAIALTAFTRPEDRARALAAGFDIHLPKPLEPTSLVGALTRLVPPRARP